MFSVIDAVLWRPLPYPAPERLAHVATYDPARGIVPTYTAVDGRTWERIRDEGHSSGSDSQAGFLVAVGAFTLLLAIVGLYGIVGYEVRERRSELGLRMSLGASPGRAVWAASARGIVLAVYGVALGGVLGASIARTLLAGLLYGVSPFDPATLVVVVGSLLSVAAAASAVPAARVARIDPAEVLRAG